MCNKKEASLVLIIFSFSNDVLLSKLYATCPFAGKVLRRSFCLPGSDFHLIDRASSRDEL